MPYGKVQIVDSHTGGEPTRVVIHGGPDLGGGPVSEKLRRFKLHHDDFRTALVTEPRGSEAMVGALLYEAVTPGCVTGAIFFNNKDYLGMCGHGTMGIMVTLAHLGRISPGYHRIETPAGVIGATLHNENDVTIENVPSYRSGANVEVEVPGFGRVSGDIAWGGNWFYLVKTPAYPLDLESLESLLEFTCAIRSALATNRITGKNGEEIDHIELCAPARRAGINSRNFVLCPGNAYDRSPCGTGTSAKLACLFADGLLRPGEIWRQESIVGSVFESQFRLQDGLVIASIRGTAFITSEAAMVLDPRDPFCMGIPRHE